MTSAVALDTNAPRRLAPEALEHDECERLLAQHLTEAVDHLGPAALGVIDLPPLTGGSLEPGQLRVAAALFWAKELELAGLPGFVERLAEGVFHGTILLPIESAGDVLGRYYRGRDHRLTAGERASLYQRIFGRGDDEGGDVPALFDRLVALLCELGRATDQQGVGHVQAEINVVARDLAGVLSSRTAGIAAFAARDISDHVRLAEKILKDPDLSIALGGRGMWNILRMHALEVLGRPVEPGAHVHRAQTGRIIVSWLADAAFSLEGGRARVTPRDPVVQAAFTWQALAGPT